VALSITRADTGRDLLDPTSPLRLELAEAPLPEDRIVTAPRVGIDYAAEPWRSVAWRFADAGSDSVSRPHPGPRRSLGR
jgi:DNA-3-methyladenine glycosylase